VTPSSAVRARVASCPPCRLCLNTLCRGQHPSDSNSRLPHPLPTYLLPTHTAGWLTSIRNIRLNFQLLYAQTGLGNQVYIGAGGAIFINTYTNYKRLKYWTNWRYVYTVGGLGYKNKNYKKETIKMTKDKVTVDYYDKEKNMWQYKVYTSPSMSPYPAPAPGPSPYTRMLQSACAE
jgi:hypothetical protein